MSTGVFTVPPHFQVAFDSNWKEIMAQQKAHRLAGLYQMDANIAGQAKRYDQIGAQAYAMRQKTARSQKTEPSDIPSFERWVRPRPYDKTTWIDEHDPIMLGSLPDPQGPTVKNHAIACNRLKDIVLINAALGVNFTGPQGTVSTALPAGQQLAVNLGGGANTGMTLAKLIASSFILDSNDVDEMDRVLVYAAKQLNNLLVNVDQVNSVLYNEVRSLFKGRVEEFMGFKFIRTQLLPIASNIRSCFCYQKEFLQMGMGADMKTHIDVLPDQSHSVQVRSVILLDATRLEEAGVVSIACDESV
jgi:hypothetical protein